MPYYFKTQISNKPSTVEFVDANDNLLNVAQTLKVNKSFEIRDTFTDEVQSVEVSYSQTGNYTIYETVYDGKLTGKEFDLVTVERGIKNHPTGYFTFTCGAERPVAITI